MRNAREQIHFSVTISEILFNRMSTVEIAVADDSAADFSFFFFFCVTFGFAVECF